MSNKKLPILNDTEAIEGMIKMKTGTLTRKGIQYAFTIKATVPTYSIKGNTIYTPATTSSIQSLSSVPPNYGLMA